MIKNKDSLKAKLKKLSEETKIDSNYLLQSFMFEGILKRISESEYKEQFVIKGGMLLTAIFGIDLRSTMDLDATLKGVVLNLNTIQEIFNKLIAINIDDNKRYELIDIKSIRKGEMNGGFRINLKAYFDNMWTNLMIDITTGDIITFKELEFEYKTLFSDEYISITSYNFETIIAEKYVATISRGINNTRMKDYYDLFLFVNLKWDDINKNTLYHAIQNTGKNRDVSNYIIDNENIIGKIETSNNTKKLWLNYQKQYEYASDIKFEDVINSIKAISKAINHK